MQTRSNLRIALLAGFFAIVVASAAPGAAATAELEATVNEEALAQVIADARGQVPVDPAEAEGLGYGACVAAAAAAGLWAVAAFCAAGGILHARWCKQNYWGAARWLCYALV